LKYFVALALCLIAAPGSAQMLPVRASSGWNPFQRTPEQPHPAVVRVIAPEGAGESSMGSGTLVAVNETQGLVITNWHVVKDARSQVNVVFPDGFRSVAQVLRTDQDWDLAALAVRKPTAQPVAIAARPPQPGEMLTIAGYGAGDYRSASGACMQYLSPAPQLPYDIIEMAAMARNGDSGGPIFNNRGELAGVLFGEGGGRTSGSHSGRVRWFLSSMMSDQPAAAPAPQQIAAREVNATIDRGIPEADWVASAAAIARPSPAALPPQQVAAPAMPSIAVAAAARPAVPLAPPAEVTGQTQTAPQDVDWELITGPTPFDKIKSFFAVVGAITLLMQISKHMKSG
jgi:S1-C subfamily serine protease